MGLAQHKGGMPDNPFDFGNLMYMMARHYKGNVSAYEIWNEENLRGETGAPSTWPSMLTCSSRATAASSGPTPTRS